MRYEATQGRDNKIYTSNSQPRLENSREEDERTMKFILDAFAVNRCLRRAAYKYFASSLLFRNSPIYRIRSSTAPIKCHRI